MTTDELNVFLFIAIISPSKDAQSGRYIRHLYLIANYLHSERVRVCTCMHACICVLLSSIPTYTYSGTNSKWHVSVGDMITFGESVGIVYFRFVPESRICSKSVQGDVYRRAFLDDDIGVRNLKFYIFNI